MSEESLDAIAGAEIFAGMTKPQCHALAEIARVREVSAGERLFSIGESADALMLVQRGSVALKLPLKVRGESRDVTLDHKTPGAALAWSALAPPYKFTLSAEAVDDVRLLVFERTSLSDLAEANAELRANLFTGLSQLIGGRVATLEAILIRELQRQIDGA